MTFQISTSETTIELLEKTVPSLIPAVFFDEVTNIKVVNIHVVKPLDGKKRKKLTSISSLQTIFLSSKDSSSESSDAVSSRFSANGRILLKFAVSGAKT